MYAVDSISADSNNQGEPYFNVTFSQNESALTKGSPTLESNHLIQTLHTLDSDVIRGTKWYTLI